MQVYRPLVTVIGTALFIVALSASAQTFPAKAVRIITPFPPGSGPDSVLRIVGDKLSKIWSQSVIIENRPGANGFIAIEAGKKAPADGYTLVQMDDAHMSLQPHLYKNIPYDPVRDFMPVATLFRTYFFVAVPAASPWKNITDLVNAAKAKPNALTYGSWFVGSPGHVGAAQLEAATGTQMVHIPFKEMSQLYSSVGNNDVNWAFGTAASAGPMYKAGKVRFIAVAAPKRVAGYESIPTVAEAGGPANFEIRAWVALFAPIGTPTAIAAKIGEDVAKVLTDPDVKERFAAVGFEPYTITPPEVKSLMETDLKRYGEVIKRAKISVE
ncbi:MAG TPA: tripartite tricarboxylate transporter substrate binding protein [Casimicrobiaceae bacterium]|nr:tripartite tricarboxylate transporter substrate binding protein [Casimicrobiaceae bacterium]